MIAGPTASGKSGVALALAERIGATLVNLDALQVYRDLRLLTARPSAAEEARAPHRLFGHLGAAETYDVASWLTDARAAVADRPAILVGGTGLYLSAAHHGLAPVPAIDPAVREAVRARGQEENRAELERLDPAMAARLRPADTQRTARALEVIRATGRSLADWQAGRTGAFTRPLTGIILDPPRDALNERIERRLDAMLAGGAVEEVEALLHINVPGDAPIWRALGAHPLAAHLRGETTLAEARDRTAATTRAYAKRQRTWFRHQPPADWPRVASPAEALDRLLARVAGSAP